MWFSLRTQGAVLCFAAVESKKEEGTQKLVRAAVIVSLFPLHVHFLSSTLRLRIHARFLHPCQPTKYLTCLPRASPRAPPPSSRGLCMSKRCQPEVRGPSRPFESISRRPGGGKSARPLGDQPQRSTAPNGTNGDGTTTEPTATPNWRVSASRFWSAGSGVGRNLFGVYSLFT